METLVYEVSRDRVPQAEFATANEAFAYILRVQPFSVMYAVNHGGWSIRSVRKVGGKSIDSDMVFPYRGI